MHEILAKADQASTELTNGAKMPAMDAAQALEDVRGGCDYIDLARSAEGVDFKIAEAGGRMLGLHEVVNRHMETETVIDERLTTAKDRLATSHQGIIQAETTIRELPSAAARAFVFTEAARSDVTMAAANITQMQVADSSVNRGHLAAIKQEMATIDEALAQADASIERIHAITSSLRKRTKDNQRLLAEASDHTNGARTGIDDAAASLGLLIDKWRR